MYEPERSRGEDHTSLASEAGEGEKTPHEECPPKLYASSLEQRCTTARSIAVCWMSRLVNYTPSEERTNIATQKELLQEKHRQSDSHLSVGGVNHSGHTSTPHRPKSTVSSSSSVASSTELSTSFGMGEGERTELASYRNVELIPSNEDHKRSLQKTLHEISLSCAPLGLNSESKRSKRRTKQNVSSSAQSGGAPTKETIVEWNTISIHLRQILSSVVNKSEVKEALSEALGSTWGDIVKPSQTTMKAPVAVGEVSRYDPSWTPPKQPIYCPSQHITTLLERNSPAPHLSTPNHEFPSTPLEKKPTSTEALNGSTSSVQTTGNGAKTSTASVFHLESREEMLRRRNAAPHTFYSSESVYGTINSAATTPASFSISAAPFSPLHSLPHSLPVSPMQVPHTAYGCPYDYILVLDFEATCEERHSVSYLHEIIEFPVVVVDVRLQRVVSEFHRFVRPRYKPQLSDFCKSLTGIKQEDVDSATSLEEVIKQFERWYNATIPPGSRTVFATDGPADFEEFMHVHSVQRQGIRFPPIFYSYIDVKQTFAHFFSCQKGKIKGMLEVLHLPFIGRLHSGVDDARNIASIVIGLLQWGCTFCEVPLNHIPFPTPTLPSSSSPRDGETPYKPFSLPASTAALYHDEDDVKHREESSDDVH